MSKLPPAILEPFYIERRIFEINERVTVFDDELHERLESHKNHYMRGDIDGQIGLFDEA